MISSPYNENLEEEGPVGKQGGMALSDKLTLIIRDHKEAQSDGNGGVRCQYQDERDGCAYRVGKHSNIV